MTRLTQLYASSTLVICLGASTAMADVTAQQVWNDWRTLMSATGAQVGFEQAKSDGILTINNLSFTTNERGSGGTTVINLGSLVFQEQGDGTVIVLLPNDAPIVLTNDTTKITLNQSHKDMSLVVSGAPKDLTYSYKADALSLALVEMVFKGEKLTGATADVTISNFNGTTRVQNATLKEVDHVAHIGALSYQIDLNVVSEDIQIAAKGSMTDLRNSFGVAIPENMDDATMKGALDAGLNFIGHASYGEIDSHITFTQQGDVMTSSTTSKTGSMDMKFSRAQEDLVEMSANLSLGPIDLQSTIDVRDKEKELLLDLTLDQLGFGFRFVLPDDIEDGGLEADTIQDAMGAGAILAMNAGYDGLAVEFNAHNETEKFASNAISASSGFGLLMDRNGVGYTFDMGKTNASLTATTPNVPEIPIGPLEFSVSEIRSSMMIPMSVSKTPTPFSYSDRIIDLSISDNLWAMFDPDKLLPRDAATYILDVEGMGNWLIDPFSDAFQNRGLDAPKGELHSLSLNAFQLSGAGFDLTSAGAFTFNNDDLKTFKGIPAPTGTLDLKMTGLNALMDTLIKLGLLQEDQAFGARMGLGLFTVAGEDDDTLISHIEATDDGHVLANGKRLK